MKKAPHSLCIIFTLLTIVCLLYVSVAAASDGSIANTTQENALALSANGSSGNLTKENDGVCMVGYYTDTSGQTGPVLVGETADAVKFITTGSSDEEFDYGTIKYDGKTYYYSFAWCFMPGDFDDALTPALYKCSAGERISAKSAAREVLNVYYGKAPQEGGMENDIMYILEKYWFLFVAGAIVLIIIIFKSKGRSSSSRSRDSYGSSTGSDRASSSASSSSGGGSYYDGLHGESPNTPEWTVDDDMEMLNRISEMINRPGYDVADKPTYDPEGPVTDIECPPSSDSIW